MTGAQIDAALYAPLDRADERTYENVRRLCGADTIEVIDLDDVLDNVHLAPPARMAGPSWCGKPGAVVRFSIDATCPDCIDLYREHAS